MTIFEATPRPHSPLAGGFRLLRTQSRPLEGTEGHAEIPKGDPHLSIQADQINGSATRQISFGPFRLLPIERLLFNADKPIRLGSRALDLLIALVERHGELVDKRKLMGLVWPDTVVVEANLTVHVAALRRALGDGQQGSRYIVNVPGRGYRFVAPVTFADESRSLEPRLVTTAGAHNLPAQLTHLIGRSELVDNVVQHLALHRLTTIDGPAGIGKTAVALDMAEQLIGAFEDGVWLIYLAPKNNPDGIAAETC